MEVDFEKGSGTKGLAASGISDDTIGSTLDAAARPCTRRRADAPPALTPSIKPTEIPRQPSPPTRIRASQRIESAIPAILNTQRTLGCCVMTREALDGSITFP